VPRIGKSLNERFTSTVLTSEQAVALLTEMLPAQGKHLVQVRARDPRMIACLFVRADDATVRLCRTLGFELTRGGTGVFGLLGVDTARVFLGLSASQRAWLEVACGPRETKVLLVSKGTALLSIEATDGKVLVRAHA
jgi:hypothetical protein